MSIREDSKKIIRHFLSKAIECGNLVASFPLEYSELTRELNLESENYCRVCCNYLTGKRYIAIRFRFDKPETITLDAQAIDFLESA